MKIPNELIIIEAAAEYAANIENNRDINDTETAFCHGVQWAIAYLIQANIKLYPKLIKTD